MAVSCRLPILALYPLSICLVLAVYCLRFMAFLLTSLDGYSVISRTFCLGCVFPVLLASRLYCRQAMLLLLPLVLALEDKVVVVCWA